MGGEWGDKKLVDKSRVVDDGCDGFMAEAPPEEDKEQTESNTNENITKPTRNDDAQAVNVAASHASQPIISVNYPEQPDSNKVAGAVSAQPAPENNKSSVKNTKPENKNTPRLLNLSLLGAVIIFCLAGLMVVSRRN